MALVLMLGSWRGDEIKSRQRIEELLYDCAAGAERRNDLLSEKVAAVSARVLPEIVLMVALSTVPGGGRLDARRNRSLPFAGSLNPRYHLLRNVFLFRGLGKDRRAILGTDVVALAVERGGIVQPEEPVLQQLLVAQHGWVER